VKERDGEREDEGEREEENDEIRKELIIFYSNIKFIVNFEKFGFCR